MSRLGDAEGSRTVSLARPTLKRVKNFLAKPTNFSAWEPLSPSAWDSSSRSRIKDLSIPRTIESEEMSAPDLLLYALGHMDRIDPSYPSRLDTFTDGTEHLLLVNTSGSGKTRLVIETLYHHWGLFFTVRVDQVNRYGSSDLGTAITKFDRLTDSRTGYLTLANRRSDKFSAALSRNRKEFSELMAVLVLSRLFLLDLVYTTGRELGMSEDEIRVKWLWLQLRPSACINVDVFSLVSLSIESSWSHTDVQAQLVELVARHKERVTFVAFDEAQALNDILCDAFASSDLQALRPALREIVSCTASIFRSSRMIVSGTRVDDGLMQDAISSSGSEIRAFRHFSALGSFDEDNAPGYISHFLGSDLSSEPRVKWFFGRHRFLRVLVGHILVHGLDNAPHVIESIVQATTEFSVSNARPKMSVDLHVIITNRWLEAYSYAAELRAAAYTVLTQRKAAKFYTHSRSAVGCAMARFVDDPDVAQMDEILILLNLTRWLYTSSRWSTRAIIQRRVDDPSASTRNMALPHALALFLWRRSAVTGVKLDDIAQFVEDVTPRWANQPAGFVLASSRDGGQGFTPVKFLDGPLIYAAETFKDVADWFQHSRSPFLIPDDDMGPQLVFILDALDGPRLVFVHVEPFDDDRERRSYEVVPQNPYNFYAKKRSHRKAFREILARFPSQDGARQKTRLPSFNTLRIYCFAEVYVSNLKQYPPAAEMLLEDLLDDIGKHDLCSNDAVAGIQ